MSRNSFTHACASEEQYNLTVQVTFHIISDAKLMVTKSAIQDSADDEEYLWIDEAFTWDNY